MGLCVERLDVKVDEPSRGQGTAFFEGAAAGEQVPRSKRESVAIAVYAGCAAEENMGFETCAETDDHKRVEELLPGSEDLKQAARAKAAQIVKDRWICIETIAKALLAQAATAPDAGTGKYANGWSGYRREKTLSTAEVRKLLADCDIRINALGCPEGGPDGLTSKSQRETEQ